MNKIQRMQCAINHEEADRVPKGELAIQPELANALLGADYPLDYQHFERDKAVRELLNIDFINLGDWPQDYLGKDEKGRDRFLSTYGYEFVTAGQSKQVTKPPIADIEDAKSYKKPDICKVKGDLITRFKQETDLYVFAQIGGPVSMLNEMFDMEAYLVYCMTNTKEMRILGETVMEYEIEKAKLFLDSGADAIFIADDIAHNMGTFLPPRINEQIVFPLHKAAVAQIKRYKNVPVFFHSDGDLNKVMDCIVDNGFDGLQSLQPTAHMDIAQIKQRYGKALTLMGNIDLNYVMSFAPADEVQSVVRQTIDAAKEGGGFILSTCNTLINAIPPQNARAMYDTAQTYGVYEDR